MNDPQRPDETPTREDLEWRASLAELSAEIEPARDLWPAIAARLPHRAAPPRWWNRPAARVAAAALAAGLVGWVVFAPAPVTPPLSPTLPTPPTTTGLATPAPEGFTAAAYAETDRALSEIRDELRRAIESRQDRLPPETRALVFENLRTIDRAIGEIESALRGAPADAELVRTYVIYRERQIDLLRQANRMVARL